MGFRFVFFKIFLFINILSFKVTAEDHPVIPTLLECVTAISLFSQGENPLELNHAQSNIVALLQIIDADRRLSKTQKEEVKLFLNGLENNPTTYIEMRVGRSNVQARLRQWADLVDESETTVSNHEVDLADAVLPVEWTKRNLSLWGRFQSWFWDPKEIKAGPRRPRPAGVSSVPRDLWVESSFGMDPDAPPSFFFWTTPFNKSIRDFFETKMNMPKKWMGKLKDRSYFIFFSSTAHGDPVLFFASGSSNF